MPASPTRTLTGAATDATRGRDQAIVLADIHMPNMDGYELGGRSENVTPPSQG